ncbi:PEP-CTERM sorting domain-containing protein [Nostoc sp. HG1]|nr:PEP-CTERM sorting domain-containing protein [Nostoc sp. HG1]
MRNYGLSLLLGLTSTATVLMPITVEAATYDYSRIKPIVDTQLRPIRSNDILGLYGSIEENEGYTAFSNLDRNAPDAGHTAIRLNPLSSAYYVLGREYNLDTTGATRSATLENVKGFSNFFNYLNTNNIPLDSIGFAFGSRPGLDITKTQNLGEDKLGQDWFSRPDSPIEITLYRGNPDEFTSYLTYGTNKLIDLGYSDFYFISDNRGGSVFEDNWNIFYNPPTPASKIPDLDPLPSGLADAFLQDVAAGGGAVQIISEDQPKGSGVTSSRNDKYSLISISFPVELRVVKAVPESSSILGLLMFGVLGIVPQIAKLRKSKNSLT